MHPAQRRHFSVTPTCSFTFCSKLGDELEAVHVVSTLDIFLTLLDGLQQTGAFFRIELEPVDEWPVAFARCLGAWSENIERPASLLVAELEGRFG